MSKSTRRRAALRSQPLRPYVVHNHEPFDEMEQEWRLIAARCPSQAARLWRAAGGHLPCDYPTDDLVVEEAVWQWEQPEPPMPRQPGEIPLIHDPPGGLAYWRGYGLHDVEDATCEECSEYAPRELMADEWVCIECAKEEA